MAGEDQHFIGEAFPGRRHQGRVPAPGAAARSGQDRPRQRRGRRRSRFATCSNRYDELNAKLGEDLPPDEMEKVLEEQGKVQDRIDQTNAWELDSQLEQAMDALRLPPADADGDDAVGRRAPPRRALPAAAERAGPAAARRADEPSRRRIGRVARASPRGVSRHRRRGHARSLLPRQRRRLDPRARSRPRHPVGGQLLVVARAEAEPPGAGREGRDEAAADAAARAGMDPDVAARAPGQGQGPPERLRGAAQPGHGAEDRQRRDLHPARPAPRRCRRRGPRPAQGVRRRCC